MLDVVVVLLSTVRLPMIPSMPSATPAVVASSTLKMDSVSKSSSPGSSIVSGLASDDAGSRNSWNTLLIGVDDEQFFPSDGLYNCGDSVSQRRNAATTKTGCGGKKP